MAELIGGAVLGAFASEGLKRLIAMVNTVSAFEPVSKELASMMEDLRPIVTEIASLQGVGADDLKSLNVTIADADALVKKCAGVKKWDLLKKERYTKKVWKILREMGSFCQRQLPLLQHRNLLRSTENIKKLDTMMKGIDNNLEIVTKKLDFLTETINSNHQYVTGELKIVNEKLDLVIPAPIYKDLCSIPKLGKAPVGFDWPLNELKMKLLDDSVDCLVVYGDSGRGKTTLVTQLCHDTKIKGKFKHIFFNVVTKAPNFRKLVQNLLHHNGVAPPTFDDNNQAVNGLRQLLKKLIKDGPILMVLDDVWPGEESLLENFKPINLAGYKILVSSRSDFPSFGPNYELKPLEHEDARALLIQWAPRPPNAPEAEYENLLKKILKRCKGLPIVIRVVGISLKERPLHTWKVRLESWPEEESVLDNSHPTVLVLQPIFNALESNLKECFLDMGSLLEYQKISASVIIDIWVELYGKGSSSMYMKYLKDLASQNLLELIPLGRKEPEDGFYNEFLVTQHDAFRELAIRQSELEAILERKRLTMEIREDKLPDWFQSELEILERKRLNQEISEDDFPDWCESKLEAIRQSKVEAILARKRLNLEIREDKFPDWCLNLEKPINARLLSISTDDLFSSNWVKMKFPNVEALVLNISSSNYALPSFIETMEKLKVVIIINHGFYPAILRNFPSLSSLPNLKRIRLEKVSITFLNILRLQRSSLSKLSLVMCRFGEVSHDTKEIVDVSKALPSLQEIDIDYCYDLVELPVWFSEVVSLKTLSITNCNKLSKLPEAIGNLSKLETLRLISCINLSELPETTERLNSLRFLDISGCLGLKKLPLEIGKMQQLKKISMRKCSGCELPDSVRDLENLEVTCDEETRTILWERLKLKMKTLTVYEEETQHNLNWLHMF